MEIDWSKAPVWANAVIASQDGQEFYVSQWGGISARQRVGYSWAESEACADMVVPHDWVLITIRDDEWVGAGLPPVGTACEHRTGHGMNWSIATILAHGEKKVFYRDRDGHEWTRLYDEIEFRQIRTPEQIANEERDAAIDEMLKVIGDAGDNPSWPDLMADLYAAGYRKQATP